MAALLCAGSAGVPVTRLSPSSPTFGNVTSTGDCRIVAGGVCVTSPFFPDVYPPNSKCNISGVPTDQVLVVIHFDTEEDFDTVTINGVDYSGQKPELNDVKASDGTIRWSSDFSLPGTGWKLCWQPQPPSPPSPPALPPSPPMLPAPPPLPEFLTVSAQMCAVVDTPPSHFDAAAFQKGLAEALGFFPPLITGLQIGSCRWARPAIHCPIPRSYSRPVDLLRLRSMPRPRTIRPQLIP
jgi:hypothetical protein